jgi:hypothetical protein
MQQLVHGVVDELLAHRPAGRPERAAGRAAGPHPRALLRRLGLQVRGRRLLLDAGVQLLFHALAVGVRDGLPAGRIDRVLVETKSGRQAIGLTSSSMPRATPTWRTSPACPTSWAMAQGDALYPSTMFRIGNVDAERAQAAIGEFKAIDALMAQAADRYRFPAPGAILRPQRNPREWRANVTQLGNDQGQAVDATDARQLSAAEVEGRRQIVEYMRFLRAEVPGFEAAEMPRSRPQVGVRETRRVVGAYMLSGEDVLGGARFDDAIGLNAWPVEHAPGRAHRVGLPARRRQRLQPAALAHAGAAGRWPTCWWPAAAPAWSTWARAPRAPAAGAS